MTDDEQTAAIFDEIMQWGGVAPSRNGEDFTVSEFAAHIGRSEATARRTLMQLVDTGRLATEGRYDPIVQRTRTVWWVTQKGGTPIADTALECGVRGRE